MEATTSVDEQKLEQFMGQAVTDLGAAMNGALVMIGGKLGLWKAMAGAGPLTRGRDRRALRRRRALRARVGVGAGRQRLPRVRRRRRHVHAAARAGDGVRRRGQPGLHAGRLQRGQLGVQGPRQARRAVPRRATGFGWHEHDPELFVGTEQFFRPGYRAHLVAEWIPALEGVEEKLQAGGKVADIGCGHGISTILMAQAYPRVDGPRVRLPRRLDRAGDGDRRGRGRRGQHRVRGREREGLSRARATTWSASSTACTTWATRSER